MAIRQLKLELAAVRCVNLQERRQDELYCTIQFYNEAGTRIKHYRLPSEGYWPIRQNETIKIDAPLLIHSSDQLPMIARLTFKEEDIPAVTRSVIEFLRNLAPDFIPELLDDFLGVLYLVWLPDQRVKWVCGLNTYITEPSAVYEQTVDLMVDQEFHYELLFRIVLS